jgi:small subunit ribosomal protein S1
MSSEREEDKHFHVRPTLDAELQQELDDALGDASLEDLLDAEDSKRRELRARPVAGASEGVRVGKVIAVQGDDIFMDLGGRSEGILPAQQFEDEPLPEVGDTLEVMTEGYNAADGLVVLSRKGAVLAAAWETLEPGQVVEGRVTGHNKGGLELDVQGISAFMPVSQVERFHVDDLAQYVDQRLRCQVEEIDRADRNVILSRRALMEAEAAEAAEKLFETLQEGQVVAGVVRSIMPYGAFVDIGGADGLLHVSDMSYSRVEDPHSIVQEGSEVQVMVLKINREDRKLSLGLKQITPDPWKGAEGKWPPDTLLTGRVVRLAEFGAFLEIEEGVDGLIPIGEMTFERRIKHPSEIVKEGDTVRVRVMSVDSEKHRISLSIKRAGEDPWLGASVRWPEGSIAEGIVTRLAEFGAFIELNPGVEGLVHISELSSAHIRSVSDAVREGQTVQAKVLEVDEERRRISLSIKQLATVADYTGAASDADEAPKPVRKRKRPLKGGLE